MWSNKFVEHCVCVYVCVNIRVYYIYSLFYVIFIYSNYFNWKRHNWANKHLLFAFFCILSEKVSVSESEFILFLNRLRPFKSFFFFCHKPFWMLMPQCYIVFLSKLKHACRYRWAETVFLAFVLKNSAAADQTTDCLFNKSSDLPLVQSWAIPSSFCLPLISHILEMQWETI